MEFRVNKEDFCNGSACITFTDPTVYRGAPKKDGKYDILQKMGQVATFTRKDGKYFYVSTGCQSYFHSSDIVAHRAHVEMVVPPLRELDNPFLRQTVIVERANPTQPLIASIDRDGKAHYRTRNPLLPYWMPEYEYKIEAKYQEIDRARCEELGYKWPFS